MLNSAVAKGSCLALITALISGVAIYVNFFGVKQVPDPFVFTTAKNLLVALALAGLALLPATAERLTGPRRPVAGLFFCVWSVVCLWLVWRIAIRSGASAREALTAACLLAAATTFVYWARHLMPYDLAMAFGLGAVLAGIRPSFRGQSLSCGMLAGCAFMTYAGYWTLGGVAVAIHASLAPSVRTAVRRLVLGGIGVLLPLGVASLPSHGYLVVTILAFSKSITQGRYEEGWSLPFEYLWHAEHAIVVFWLVALVAAVWHARRGPVSPQLRIGLIGVVCIYGALAVCSTGLHRFVVYGRLARQLVPFFCLVAAHEIERLRTAPSRGLRLAAPVVLTLVALQAAFNLRVPLTQVFPEEFREHGAARVGGMGEDEYAWVNAEHIYPEPRALSLAGSQTLLEARHPLTYLPFQYEGYTPEQRSALRRADLTMRLVTVRSPAQDAAPGTTNRRSEDRLDAGREGGRD